MKPKTSSATTTKSHHSSTVYNNGLAYIKYPLSLPINHFSDSGLSNENILKQILLDAKSSSQSNGTLLERKIEDKKVVVILELPSGGTVPKYSLENDNSVLTIQIKKHPLQFSAAAIQIAGMETGVIKDEFGSARGQARQLACNKALEPFFNAKSTKNQISIDLEAVVDPKSLREFTYCFSTSKENPMQCAIVYFEADLLEEVKTDDADNFTKASSVKFQDEEEGGSGFSGANDNTTSSSKGPSNTSSSSSSAHNGGGFAHSSYTSSRRTYSCTYKNGQKVSETFYPQTSQEQQNEKEEEIVDEVMENADGVSKEVYESEVQRLRESRDKARGKAKHFEAAKKELEKDAARVIKNLKSQHLEDIDSIKCELNNALKQREEDQQREKKKYDSRLTQAYQNNKSLEEEVESLKAHLMEQQKLRQASNNEAAAAKAALAALKSSTQDPKVVLDHDAFQSDLPSASPIKKRGRAVGVRKGQKALLPTAATDEDTTTVVSDDKEVVEIHQQTNHLNEDLRDIVHKEKEKLLHFNDPRYTPLGNDDDLDKGLQE